MHVTFAVYAQTPPIFVGIGIRYCADRPQETNSNTQPKCIIIYSRSIFHYPKVPVYQTLAWYTGNTIDISLSHILTHYRFVLVWNCSFFLYKPIYTESPLIGLDTAKQNRKWISTPTTGAWSSPNRHGMTCQNGEGSSSCRIWEILKYGYKLIERQW